MKIDPLVPSEFAPRSDCHIATAIIGAGVIGGGASIIGAQTGANAQRDAAQAATNAQMNMFGQAKEQLLPYINAGTAELPNLTAWNDPTNSSSPLASLLKLTSPGADMTSTLSQLPGFKFQLDTGLQATKNALAARGLAGPGGALSTASANYATGTAQSNWQNLVNTLLNTFQTGGNSMQNLVNTGAGAAWSLTGAATQTGAQIGQNIIGAGNATAGANVATGNAIAGAANSIPSAMLLQSLLGGNSSGIYGGSGAAPNGFRHGGRPPVGRPSLVGEDGPELFVPDRSGIVVPHNVLMAMVNASKNKRRSGSRLTRH